MYDVYEAGKDIGDFCQAGSVASEQDVIDEFERYSWPSASLEVLPSGGEVLVNGATQFFASGAVGVQDHEFRLGEFRVRIEATPASYLFDFGDGSTAGSGGPGGAGAPAQVHEYAATGAYLARVDVTYSGQYWVDGEGPNPLPGTHAVTGRSITLEALEARPMLVR